MNRVFVDMDGVVVDFDGYCRRHEIMPDKAKRKPNAYAHMLPMPGALDALKKLADLGFIVWLATKPPTGWAFAYADKARWVFEHTPWLEQRLIITHDKGLLGDVGDYLTDDRMHRANCEAFKGTLIKFAGWDDVLVRLTNVSQ